MLASTPLMPLSHAQPWPYDVRINGRGYMLLPPAEIKKLPGIDNAAPTSYEYSTRNPLAERTVKFERPYLGIGTRLAAALEPRGTWYCEGIDTSCGGLAFLGPEFLTAATLTGAGQVRQLIEFDVAGTRRLVALSGTRILSSANGSTWTVARDISTQTPLQAARWRDAGTPGSMLVITVDSGEIWFWDGTSTTTTFTQAGAASLDAQAVVVEAQSFSTPPGGALSGSSPFYLLGGGLAGLEIAPGAIGVAGSGAAVMTLPDSSGRITWMTTLNDVILIFTERGLLASQVTGSSSPYISNPRPIYPELLTFDVDNGRNAVRWGQKVYAPISNGLYEIAASSASSVTLTPVGLERLVDLGVDFGSPTCFAGDSYFGYFCTYNSDTNTSYLFKMGTWVNPEDAHAANWEFTGGIHGWLAKFDAKKATAMLVSDVGATSPQKFLYIGFSNGTVDRAILPGRTPFAPSVSACRFQTSGNIYYPQTDAGFAADSKVLRAVSIFGPSLAAGLTATMSYYLEGGATVAISGTGIANGQRLEIPDGINGKLLGLKATLACSANTATPVLAGVGFHVTERSAAVLGPSFFIKADADVLDKNGQLAYRKVGRTSRNLRDYIVTDLAAAGDVACVMPDGSAAQLAIQSYDEKRTYDGRFVIQIDTTRRALAS